MPTQVTMSYFPWPQEHLGDLARFLPPSKEDIGLEAFLYGYLNMLTSGHVTNEDDIVPLLR